MLVEIYFYSIIDHTLINWSLVKTLNLGSSPILGGIFLELNEGSCVNKGLRRIIYIDILPVERIIRILIANIY